jgi:hypothetical protein
MNDKVNPIFTGRFTFADSAVKPWHPPPSPPDPRAPKSARYPEPAAVLDFITNDYIATMQAQGHVVDDVGRAAIRRMANIHYAFFMACMKAVRL